MKDSWYSNAKHRAREDWVRHDRDRREYLRVGYVADGHGKHRAEP